MATMNAAECLLENATGDRVALECGDARISYDELRAAIRQSAGAWHAAGISPGDRVLVFAPDSIDWVIAYLGIIWAGGVAVGINSRLSLRELAPILVESEARAVWCEDEHAPGIAEVAREMRVPPLVAVAHADRAGGWHGRLARATALDAVARDTEDPALWIGTSGTTGVPKAVIHAQRVVVNAHSFAGGLLGLHAGDRLYATSKLFFAYALGNSLLAGLRAGATVILDREWPTAERAGEMVARHRPTLVFSVPTLYHKMLQTGVAAGMANVGIRHFVSAGEALPGTLRKGWRAATGLAPVSGYGTSETMCLMLYSDRDDGTLAPTPLTEVRFDERLDASLPQRLWVRHSTIALGYWMRPEAQADGFAAGGWYSPGDMFLRRPEERLEFAGRNDDMLKIAGQWVSTQWVEQALAAACDDTLLNVAAVGVGTSDGLTGLAVLAVANPARATEAKERLRAAIDAMPKHRQPRWVHWLDSLPLTATGKLQRSQLRRLHEQALAAAAGGVGGEKTV